MSESGVAVGLLAAAMDALLAVDFARLDRDELLGLTRGLEAERRRLPVVEHAVLAEVGQRGLYAELGASRARTAGHARPVDEVLGPDTRTPGERCHDALQEAARRLLAAGDLPALAGLPSTLVITMTLDQLESRAGAATTLHGGTLSIDAALKLASQGKLLPVVLNNAGGVLAYGRDRRLASRGQRLALAARDRGCTLPGCHRTAAQSEIHHILDWAKGGHTDLDTLAIASGWHNNEAPKQGWTATMINGVPHWIPPACRDPQQKPLRNTLHDPQPVKPPDND